MPAQSGMPQAKSHRNFLRGVRNRPRRQSLWSGSNGTTLARRPKNCRLKLRSCQRPARLTETHCGSNSGLLLMHATGVTKPIGSQKEMSDDVRYCPKADMPKNAIDVAIGGKADMAFCTAYVCL